MIIDVHIDSLHVGHKTGLYYDSDDFPYKPNKINRWNWKCWNLLWDDVVKLKKKHKARLHVSILGEAGDINYSARRSGEFWTQSYKVASDNAIKILEPISEMADWMHFFRGTTAHVGDQESTIDEIIADNFDNIVRTDDDRAAHAHATYELEGVLFDVAHHGKNKGKWAEENPLTALRNEIVLDRAKDNSPIPDVITRGHMHWSGETTPYRKPFAVQVPSFQLPYEFIHRINIVGRRPEVGGAIFLCNKGEFEYEPKYYKPERNKTWQPK